MVLQLLYEQLHRFERLVAHQPNIHRKSSVTHHSTNCRKTHFSLSIILPEILGITFVANSSTSNTSTLAMNAINPATLACTNGSFNALEKAGTRTLRLVLYPKDGPRRPIRIQALVRIEASGSICIFARC